MKSFSTFDVEKILNIKRTRLQEWMNRGFIKPSQASAGQGTKALFTREDLYGIQLFSELLKFGLNRDVATKIVDWLFERPIRMQEEPVKWDSDVMNIHVQLVGKEGGQQDVFYSFGKPQLPDRQPGARGPSRLMTIVVELSTIKQMVDRKLD